MDIERLREVVIHPSANRTNRLLGADRKLILIAALIAVSLAFSLATLWGCVASLCFWLTSVAVLQRMARQIRCYGRFICATSGIALFIRQRAAFFPVAFRHPRIGDSDAAE